MVMMRMRMWMSMSMNISIAEEKVKSLEKGCETHAWNGGFALLCIGKKEGLGIR